jgi:hypothetical protein
MGRRRDAKSISARSRSVLLEDHERLPSDFARGEAQRALALPGGVTPEHRLIASAVAAPMMGVFMEPQSSAGVSRLAGLARQGVLLDLACAALSAVFAVTLAWGALDGLFGLSGMTFAGDKAGVDASALYVGQPLYADPSVSYASSVYTPLLPVLGAALDHMWFWRSWVPLLTFASSIVMVVVVARLVYDGSRRQAFAVIEAVGVGALCYWLVGELAQGFFWNDRPDQLSWTLGIVGLLLTPRAVRSNGAALGSIMLLSAAFWAKQTALVAAAAALVWLAIAAWRHRVSWLRALSLAAAFVFVNGVAVAVVDWLTHGWFIRIAFEWPTRQPCCEMSSNLVTYLKGFTVEFSIRYLFGAFVFLAVGVAVGVAATRSRSLTLWRDQAWQLLPVAIFTPLALAAAIITRHKIGAAPNHDLGLAWGLVLLTAGGYRYLRHTVKGTWFLLALVALLLVSSQLVTSRQLRGHDEGQYLAVPPLRPKLDWNAVPADLAAYARKHHVFHPDYGDLSIEAAHEAYPSLNDLTGFMYVGRTPDYLARLIVHRRFELVFPYSKSEATHRLTSGNGRYEENYLWKINRAIDLEYRPAPGVPRGGRIPVPGADPAPWLTHCWGPYSVDGISLRQHIGGGFWCAHGTVLTLRETPAAFADLRSQTTKISGTVRLSLRHGGTYRVSLERNGRILWQVTGRRAPRRLTTLATPRSQRWISIPLPTTQYAQLSLGASRGSSAAFDLAAVNAVPA